MPSSYVLKILLVAPPKIVAIPLFELADHCLANPSASSNFWNFISLTTVFFESLALTINWPLYVLLAYSATFLLVPPLTEAATSPILFPTFLKPDLILSKIGPSSKTSSLRSSGKLAAKATNSSSRLSLNLISTFSPASGSSSAGFFIKQSRGFSSLLCAITFISVWQSTTALSIPWSSVLSSIGAGLSWTCSSKISSKSSLESSELPSSSSEPSAVTGISAKATGVSILTSGVSSTGVSTATGSSGFISVYSPVSSSSSPSSSSNLHGSGNSKPKTASSTISLGNSTCLTTNEWQCGQR